jgi:pimeloyl-ACP methyl ester carboxylesterase
MPRIRANAIDIEYEEFGDREAPAILLIMGLAGQLIHWPDEFCVTLAHAGYRVIRFDNRDVGLSTKLDHLGKPDVMRSAIRALFRLPVAAPYKLDDMAADALGLLDALGIKTAHLVGASMGGMIAQIIAAKHPQRCRSLTLIMTTSGNPWLPKASLRVQLRLVKRPQQTDRESLIAHSMQTWRLIGSPAYQATEEYLRAKVERAFDRGYHPRGMARQTVAILASGSRVRLLSRIETDTLVIHGADDPLVPVAAARELARRIAGARLEIIPGMGHDFPAELMARIAGLIVRHVRGAEKSSARDPVSSTAARSRRASAASPARADRR